MHDIKPAWTTLRFRAGDPAAPFGLLAAMIFLVLAACATLDEEACREGNWAEIGRVDGASGRSPAFVEQHAEACAGYGIAPDRAAWEAGRQEGLRLYCTERNAWKEGARGIHLRNVCPVADEARLLRANDRGLNWHWIGRDIDDAERRISEINRALATLPDGDPARAGLVAERSRLRLEILRLRARRIGFRDYY